jgi:hypothetical protein
MNRLAFNPLHVVGMTLSRILIGLLLLLLLLTTLRVALVMLTVVVMSVGSVLCVDVRRRIVVMRCTGIGLGRRRMR